MNARVLCVLVLLGGCSGEKKEEEATKKSRTTSVQTTTGRLPQTSIVKYQGRGADEWGPQLLDLDTDVASNAAGALQQIGPESLRFYYEGLKSSNYNTRYISASCFAFKGAEQYSDVFLPIFKGFLKDESHDMRLWGATMIARSGYKDGLSSLRAAHAVEKHEKTKTSMAGYIAMLEKKK